MNRLIFIIAFVTALFVVCTGCRGKSESGEAAKLSPDAPIWACPTGNFKGDNFTSLKCPTAPAISWEIDLKGNECTPPIINHEGNIIIGTSEGLQCFNPEGKQVWTADVSTHIKCLPVLDNESRIIVPYGEKLVFLNRHGKTITTKTITKYATHQPTVDALGRIYVYCMEPVDMKQLAPEPPADLAAQSTFLGHIYMYEPKELKEEFHIKTGIINCPIRISPFKNYIDFAFYGPKLFDSWRVDEPSDPVKWKTNLVFFTTGRKIPIEGIEHGIVDMFADREGTIHFFGHTEHQPYPEELNAPVNEFGFVYRVLLFSYNPEENIVRKEHWPWMTPEEASAGTYKEYRRHFNRVRFLYNAKGLESYAPAFVQSEAENNIRDEVIDFVKGCLYMIMTEDGYIIGGTDSIRCFDVKLNKVIWEIDGDPSTVALGGDGGMYCLLRLPDEDKCVLRSYVDNK